MLSNKQVTVTVTDYKLDLNILLYNHFGHYIFSLKNAVFKVFLFLCRLHLPKRHIIFDSFIIYKHKRHLILKITVSKK